MKVAQIEVEVGDAKEQIFVRSLPYRKQMKLFSILQSGAVGGDIEKAAKKGKLSADSMADYQVRLIAESVTDEFGKTLFTDDDVDEWNIKKIIAYASAIDKYIANKTDPSVIAGN